MEIVEKSLLIYSDIASDFWSLNSFFFRQVSSGDKTSLGHKQKTRNKPKDQQNRSVNFMSSSLW